MSPCGLGFFLSQPFFVSSLGPKVSLCSATNWVACLTIIDIKRLWDANLSLKIYFLKKKLSFSIVILWNSAIRILQYLPKSFDKQQVKKYNIRSNVPILKVARYIPTSFNEPCISSSLKESLLLFYVSGS